MPLSHEQAVERGRRGGRAAQAKLTHEQQAEAARRARRALALREIVAGWPELTEAQQQRLRALLRPVPEAGDAPAA
jgi:uncharacterized protein YoaH (UPF0181 family)